MMGKIIISYNILPKSASDHKPIMLKIEEEEVPRPNPFLVQPIMEISRWFYERCSQGMGTSSCGIAEFCMGKEAKKYQSCIKGMGKAFS